MSGISTLRLEGVTKRYGGFQALTDVSFDVKAGQVVAVVGANGAGKSTLLGILSLATRPTLGTISFDGCPLKGSEADLRRKIGLLSHDPMLYPDLTARENLIFFARLFGAESPSDRVQTAVERFYLDELADAKPVRLLSKGQIQRAALARAFIGEPDLLLLDEPAAGMDKRSKGCILEAVDAFRQRGGIAFVTTHEPDLAASVATRAFVLHGGRIVADLEAQRDPDAWRTLCLESMEGLDR